MSASTLQSNLLLDFLEWNRSPRNPVVTTPLLELLERMVEKGMKIEEEVVHQLLCALHSYHRPNQYELCFHLEQILLQVCGQMMPSKDLIRMFMYFSEQPYTHAFEELLVRYDGPVLSVDWFYHGDIDHLRCYEFSYIETLMGCPHVIDTEELRPIYEELQVYQAQIQQLQCEEELT